MEMEMEMEKGRGMGREREMEREIRRDLCYRNGLTSMLVCKGFFAPG